MLRIKAGDVMKAEASDPKDRDMILSRMRENSSTEEYNKRLRQILSKRPLNVGALAAIVLLIITAANYLYWFRVHLRTGRHMMVVCCFGCLTCSALIAICPFVFVSRYKFLGNELNDRRLDVDLRKKLLSEVECYLDPRRHPHMERPFFICGFLLSPSWVHRAVASCVVSVSGLRVRVCRRLQAVGRPGVQVWPRLPTRNVHADLV